MADVRHRIGLGTVGNATTPGGTAKNDITAKGETQILPVWTFDSTAISFDSTVRKFDESL